MGNRLDIDRSNNEDLANEILVTVVDPDQVLPVCRDLVSKGVYINAISPVKGQRYLWIARDLNSETEIMNNNDIQPHPYIKKGTHIYKRKNSTHLDMESMCEEISKMGYSPICHSPPTHLGSDQFVHFNIT